MLFLKFLIVLDVYYTKKIFFQVNYQSATGGSPWSTKFFSIFTKLNTGKSLLNHILKIYSIIPFVAVNVFGFR